MAAMILDTTLSTISLVFNILHISVLVKFYKANNNTTILIYLAVNDITRSFVGVLTSNCPAQLLLAQYKMLCTMSSIVNNTLIALTLASLTMAGIDCYLAVCKPFAYEDSFFTRHFNKIAIAFWFLIAGIVTVQNTVISDACVLGSKMCIIYSGEPVFYAYLTPAFVYCGTSLTIISVCYLKIFKEFKSMLDTLQKEAKNTKRMSIVVGTIAILFFMLYLPIVFGIVAAMSGRAVGLKTWIYLYSLLTVHGIVNAATYCWQKKGYRKQLKSLFSGNNRVTQVTVMTANTSI